MAVQRMDGSHTTPFQEELATQLRRNSRASPRILPGTPLLTPADNPILFGGAIRPFAAHRYSLTATRGHTWTLKKASNAP